MIEQTDRIEPGAVLRADVCIIGGGAAGITLALELGERGVDTVLMEAGDWDDDAAAQALYAGEVADERMHCPPDRYRQRRFGGSTTIWGGRCMPFDPIDFEARPWIPHSGWPIPYEDVARCYPKANELVEAGRSEYDASSAFPTGMPALIPGLDGGALTSDGLERFSCPTDFARRYRQRLRTYPSLRVFLDANCVGFDSDPARAHVDAARFSTLGGKTFSVRAERFVVAIGGIETARLLLTCALGNDHDVVGRYYMCHLAGTVGRLELDLAPGRVHHGYVVSPDGVYCRRRIALRAAKQTELGVGNAVARLHFPRITDPSHRSGVLSTLYLARRLISYEYGKRLNDGYRVDAAARLRHVVNLFGDPLDTAAFAWQMFWHRKLSPRKFPSVILRNRRNLFSLDVHGEQIPDPDSRVTLVDGSRDALGMPRVRVDWRYSQIDVRTVAALVETIAQEVSARGLGRLLYDPDRIEEELTRFGAYGGHHIGTTRMGRDPRNSVVDPDCRVHGVHNLFVSGSAVFPTSSQANPTLTIVAMAIRLAAHLTDAEPAEAVDKTMAVA